MTADEPTSPHGCRPNGYKSYLLLYLVLPVVFLVMVGAGAPGKQAPATAESQAPIFGVATRGEWADAGVQGLIGQAGIRWVRTSVSWASVQPSPDVFDWSSADAEILRAQETGVLPIVLVWQNPAWAATTTCGPIDRVPLSAFATFVSALATRYNGTTVAEGVALPRVDFWEFYNEPDNRQTSEAWVGGCWGEAAAEYAEMLAVAWSAVHTVNLQGKVVFGSVAAETVTYNGQPLFNFDTAGGDFVDDALAYMQAHRHSPYFDVFGFHYFPAFHTVWDSYGSGLIGKAAYYQARLESNGMARPLICTEAGRRSDPGQVIDGIPGSDEEQSNYVVRLFVQGVAAGLDSVIWFNLGDVYQSEQGGWMGWGLLDGNYQPKPAYHALRVLTEQLADATFHEILTATEDVEGYLFSRPDGGDIMVVWSRDGLAHSLPFAGNEVHVTDKWGAERIVHDGQPGDEDSIANGIVVVTVTGSPVYIALDNSSTPTPTGTVTPTAVPASTATPTVDRRPRKTYFPTILKER